MSNLYKFTNCIYILIHPTAYLVNNIQTYKIGSTKNLPERMLTYKTYYPIDKNVIVYFYIKNYNCYDLDNDIKKYFNIFNIKNNGGIEFYYNITIEKITNYFNSVNIQYEVYLDNDYEKYYIYKSISEIEIPFNVNSNLASGSAQKGINQNNFLNIEIPIPTIEIQEKIINECDYYNKQIETLKKENELLVKENHNIINLFLQNNKKSFDL